MSTNNLAIPQRKQRTFVSDSIDLNSWDSIAPYYTALDERAVNNVEELKQWLNDWSELETALQENSRWIYVRTTVDTTDEKAKADQVNLYTKIYPHVIAIENKLSKKFIDSPYTAELDQELFFTTLRKIKNQISLFREENIPLDSELNIKQSKYDEITGAQSITYKGNELTVQQAAVYLKSNDRTEREEVYKLIADRRLQDADTLDNLMTELIALRHKIATNAGYKNYLEYRFAELGRFDYTAEDCVQFHKSVEETVIPVLNKLAEERKAALGLDKLRPWDAEVDTSGKPALKPISNVNELVDKTISAFNKLDPYFGERIAIMNEMKYLDLDSRLHKGPGGYNMTMPEIGVPFIFMNSANDEHDLITMVHEGGHAIHTFLAHKLELNMFKDVTSEIAEVASMGMELMSMEHWDMFYTNPDDLKRAKKNHLQYILSILAKTCQGDSFQHWMYTNPTHTVAERRAKWAELNARFTPDVYDWNGIEHILETGYHRILHFYVVPFYYIEYAFAQLGALGLWKNFKQDKAKAIQDYKNALSLGYTKSIPVFYETAGTKFDFSKAHISSLIEFLESEVDKLK
ncbi:MAG: M3 family oligoendopeptidase [Bacteroidetes bacterium]|nr:M3 family oligoendopeptidase [Bacteroidota bacterium]